MKGMVVEWAPFRLQDGVTEEELLDAAAALESDFLERQPGYVGRELLRGGDGNWCDLVHWRDDASAQAAMGHAMQSDVCARYFALMRGMHNEDPGAGVLHFEVRAAFGTHATPLSVR